MSSPSAISGTQSVHPLFQAILDNPTDSYLKLIYSDFLEEQGKSAESLAWRWIGENGKYPENRTWGNPESWDWWPHWMIEKRNSHLIRESIVQSVMKLDRYYIGGRYDTQSEAYLDLVRVLVENPQFME